MSVANTTARTGPRPITRSLWPILADLGCVLALAAGGRSAHDASESVWILLVIAWPFALAAGVAHLGLTWSGRRTGRVWPEGVIVLVVTYALGMALRGLTGRGLAPGFLVVAAIFLTMTMLGWRGVAHVVKFDGAWPQDPRLDPFRDSVWELSRDGRIAAHLTTQVGRMRSFPFLWVKQEQLWYQVNWLDGRRDRPEEDYGPGWYTVAELDRGKFKPDWSDDVFDASRVGGPAGTGS